MKYKEVVEKIKSLLETVEDFSYSTDEYIINGESNKIEILIRKKPFK